MQCLPNGENKSLHNLSLKDLYQELLLNNLVIITSKNYADHNVEWNHWYSYQYVNK